MNQLRTRADRCPPSTYSPQGRGGVLLPNGTRPSDQRRITTAPFLDLGMHWGTLSRTSGNPQKAALRLAVRSRQSMAGSSSDWISYFSVFSLDAARSDEHSNPAWQAFPRFRSRCRPGRAWLTSYLANATSSVESVRRSSFTLDPPGLGPRPIPVFTSPGFRAELRGSGGSRRGGRR
mgnify:CR=1 FL=1